MSMKDNFKLPVKRHYEVISDKDGRQYADTDSINCAVIAINYHDELVELLTNLDLYLCEDREYLNSPMCMKIDGLLAKIEGK